MNAKITLIIAIFIVACGVISAIGISKMNELNNSLNGIVDTNVPRIIKAKDLINLATELKNQTKILILESEADKINKIGDHVDSLEKQAYELIDELSKIATEESRRSLSDAKDLIKVWHDSNLEVRDLSIANKNAEAIALANGKPAELLDKLGEALVAVTDRNLRLLAEESKRTDVLYAESKMTIIRVSLVSIFAGISFAFLIMRALNACIDRVIDGLNDSSTQVTSAAQQIASSSQELSQSATEQASSLEETSSAVEEMNTMVQRLLKMLNRVRKAQKRAVCPLFAAKKSLMK